MSFVLDASVTMTWCFVNETTSYSQAVLASLLNSYAEVPAIWSVEVTNVLAINERKERIASFASEEFLQTLASLDIRINPPTALIDGRGLLALARQHRLTAYDTAYLELAKRKGLPIASFDKDLLRAASLEGVPLVKHT